VSAELGAAGAVLLGSLPDPAAALERTEDRRIVLLHGNRALGRSLGRPHHELPRADLQDLLEQQQFVADRVLEGVHRSFDQQCEVGRETVRERPHGRYVYFGMAVPVSPTQVVLIERDISEERRNRRRLEELEALTETGTWSWNLIDGDLDWSPELGRIVGVGEAFRAHLDVAYDVIHPDDRDRVRRTLVEVQDTGLTGEFTYRVVRPSGEQRIVCGRASRAVDREQRPIRVFGTMQDVTERRALEAGEEARQRMMADLLQASGTLQGSAARGLRPGELAHLRATRSERDEMHLPEPGTEPDERRS
jgi:PAS domain S-box-containing protein